MSQKSFQAPGSQILPKTPQGKMRQSTSDSVTFNNQSKDIQHITKQENNPVEEFNRVKEIAFLIVLIAFNIFAIWKAGYLWVVSFIYGMFFRHHVNRDVTEFMKGIIKSDHAIKILVPGTIFFYCINQPAALTAHACLAGAHAGSFFGLYIEKNIIKKLSETVYIRG